jgi:hypothetical protein
METVCNLADWPVALRGDNLAGRAGGFAPSEVRAYVRKSIAFAGTLLERGELLAIFPEGYPTIDPAGSRKPSDDAFLPFAPGVLAIVERAERATAAPVPILPVGFRYAPAGGDRFDIAMRVGPPLEREPGTSRAEFVRALEARVRSLSQ